MAKRNLLLHGFAAGAFVLLGACSSDPTAPACTTMPTVTVGAGAHPSIGWTPACGVQSVSVVELLNDTVPTGGWFYPSNSVTNPGKAADVVPPMTMGESGGFGYWDSVVAGHKYYVELDVGGAILGKQNFTAH